jgi:hypothetical protein
MRPLAREDRLLVREVADEVLVYDLSRHEAHCLNRTAGWVWRQCDGRTTVAQMATRLAKDLGVRADEATVWLALERLDDAHLLAEPLVPHGRQKRHTRRDALRGMGRAGTVALLPVVLSIVAPRAAQAATCVDSCAPTTPFLTPCEFSDCIKVCCGDASGVNQCVSAGDQTCDDGT